MPHLTTHLFRLRKNLWCLRDFVDNPMSIKVNTNLTNILKKDMIASDLAIVAKTLPHKYQNIKCFKFVSFHNRYQRFYSCGAYSDFNFENRRNNRSFKVTTTAI